MKRQSIRKGSIVISFLLFPITIYYLSPDLIIQGITEGIIAGSFIFFVLITVLSLFLGRAFCGWLCPAGGLQEICTMSSSKPAKGGKRNWIKYFIWTPWIISIAVLFISSNRTKVINVFYETYHGISVAEPAAYIIYYGVVGLIVIMSFAGGRRAFCHYVCWMAPFMVIGSKISNILRLPSLRLAADKEKCINCGVCSKKCPMSLAVSQMVQKGEVRSSECILCGECADTCPKNAVKFSFCSNVKDKLNENKHYISR